MAQISGETAAVKDEQRIFICGQLALELVKLHVGDADGRGNVPFIEFSPLGPRIHKDHCVGLVLLGDILNGNGGIITFGFQPCGKTVGENFDIGIAEFFRLPGGFVTQLSGGPATIEYEQGIFVSRQFVGHLVKLAVRNADRCWNMPLGIFGFVGA